MSRERAAVEVAAIWPDGTEEDEGIVVDWFIREGAEVTAGQTLCSVQVEKVSVDVPAPTSGRLVEIVLDEDDEFGRSDTLAWIETE